MKQDEIKVLQEELEQFRKEKDKIRKIIGAIGGKTNEQQNKIWNIAFILLIAILFILDLIRHLGGIELPFPPMFSLELGLLLVSIKIIWMIHNQMKVEHFQFWMLNAIEYRINDISKRIQKMEEKMGK